jgi:hypothetical protein
MAGLLRDTRFAVRQLRRNLGFTITATVMLAVAICANSTVFSWIDGTMLRPIPGARDTGDLVSLQRGNGTSLRLRPSPISTIAICASRTTPSPEYSPIITIGSR